MTLPPDSSEKLGNAPFNDLMRILLSQFQRLLADNGVSLTADDMLAVAQAIASRTSHPKLSAIRKVIQNLVRESVELLDHRWGLTFLQSLYAKMDDIDNWETTADFIEIANEKSNAELRIAAGSALLVAIGDLSFAPYLLNVIHHDNGMMDVDAVFAKRALLHISRRDSQASDWLEQVKIWLNQQ